MPTPSHERANVEVMILTHNEEINLPYTLESLAGWVDKVHVIDSGSTDGTPEVARKYGVNFVSQKWLGYAGQKNWAIDNIPWQSDWIFIIDADEAVTPELREAILGVTRRDPARVAESGFYINRMFYFLERRIRHCGFFPSYNLRLFKKGRARYEQRDVHEHMKVDGPKGRLPHYMLHNDRRGLEHYIAKHNRYSTLEAREILRDRAKLHAERAANLERGIAFRRWLKLNVLPRLPLIGLWRFTYMYILRLGILDGLAGFRFSLFIAMYDTMIAMKLAEFKAMGLDREPDRIGVGGVQGLAQAEGTAQRGAPAAAKA